MNMSFEKASLKHIDIIFTWLAKPHMMEFWDNSQEHKDDILNFIYSRKQHYFYGTTNYFVGSINNEEFCFLLADISQPDQELSELCRQHMSKSGHTIVLDFGIGNTKYLEKGLAAPSLKEFISFYNKSIDPLADTFFIDPDKNNPRARHVYGKAGFEEVGEFEADMGAFKGCTSCLMVKKI